MSEVVIDASVIIKWVFPWRGEADTAAAMRLHEAVRSRQLRMVQPIHWLAEVAAALVGLEPDVAESAVGLLAELDLSVDDRLEVYTSACALSRDLNHHLFDTLYHAVALASPGRELITADDRYFRKARKRAAIRMLADWGASG